MIRKALTAVLAIAALAAIAAVAAPAANAAETGPRYVMSMSSGWSVYALNSATSTPFARNVARATIGKNFWAGESWTRTVYSPVTGIPYRVRYTARSTRRVVARAGNGAGVLFVK